MTNNERVLEIITKIKSGETIRVDDYGCKNPAIMRFWYENGMFYTSFQDWKTDYEDAQDIEISQKRLVSELEMIINIPSRYRIFKRLD